MRGEEWDESDEWDEGAESEEEDLQTQPCPYCGAEIYDDAERCPHCGKYISEFDTPGRRQPWWVILGVILCLYLVYRWTLGG